MSVQNLNPLLKWIDDVSVYPPAEIYFNAPKKREKEERKVKAICERLYRFNWEGCERPNPIGKVRDIIREMEVISIMFEGCKVRPKTERIVRVVALFLDSMYHLVHQLEDMHGQHNALINYYEGWSVTSVHLDLQAVKWGMSLLSIDFDYDPDYEYFTELLHITLDEVQK